MPVDQKLDVPIDGDHRIAAPVDAASFKHKIKEASCHA